MKCLKCGNPVNEDAVYCMNCGANMQQQQDEKICEKETGTEIKVKHRRIPISTLISSIIALGLAIVLMLSIFYSPGNKDKKFSTPEEVIDYFVKCIDKNDYEGAIKLFSINGKVDGYDFNKSLDRIQVFMAYNTPSPSEYDAYDDLNRAYFTSLAANQIKLFTYSFLLPEDMLSGQVISLKDSEYTASKINKKLDPSKLNKLELKRIDLVYPELQNSAVHKKNIKSRGQMYGLNDVKEYFVLYELDGTYYAGALTVVEYNGSWYIDALNSMLGGTNTSGMASEISEIEYLKMIEK